MAKRVKSDSQSAPVGGDAPVAGLHAMVAGPPAYKPLYGVTLSLAAVQGNPQTTMSGLRGDCVIVSQSLAQSLGLVVGDAVEILIRKVE